MCPNSVICVLLGLTVSMYTLAKQQASFLETSLKLRPSFKGRFAMESSEALGSQSSGGPGDLHRRQGQLPGTLGEQERRNLLFNIQYIGIYNLESYGKFLLANSLSFLTLLPYLF